MRRELALGGAVATVFGLGSYYATDHFGGFSAANLALGGAALAGALATGARSAWAGGSPHARRALGRGVGLLAAALVAAVGLERAAALSGLRFDWTAERSYQLAPATRRILAEECGSLDVLLFYDARDPRVRRTRLLVDTLARHGDLAVRELEISASPAELDAYGVGTSNSLVFQRRSAPGGAFERAERPGEGAVFEALHRLCGRRGGAILALRGEGQGDVERRDELGYSGLAAALATEGYRVTGAATAALREIPDDVQAVLAIAPRRRLQPAGLAALARYLARGGRLVALLEPGVESGLEALLADWGLAPAPASGLDPGAEILAAHYETHPATQGLDRQRMTYFPGARGFALRKPLPSDRVTGVVYAAPDYQPIAVAGRYARDGHETRIFAVGDADFASNLHLRTLYNLDLVMNGVHWALSREPAITLRPKLREPVQFPLPATEALRTLYGVGLLLPELLLIAGGVVWLRLRRD